MCAPRLLSLSAVALLLTLGAGSATAQAPIKLGDINTYSGIGAPFTGAAQELAALPMRFGGLTWGNATLALAEGYRLPPVMFTREEAIALGLVDGETFDRVVRPEDMIGPKD